MQVGQGEGQVLQPASVQSRQEGELSLSPSSGPKAASSNREGSSSGSSKGWTQTFPPTLGVGGGG